MEQSALKKIEQSLNQLSEIKCLPVYFELAENHQEIGRKKAEEYIVSAKNIALKYLKGNELFDQLLHVGKLFLKIGALASSIEILLKVKDYFDAHNLWQKQLEVNELIADNLYETLMFSEALTLQEKNVDLVEINTKDAYHHAFANYRLGNTLNWLNQHKEANLLLSKASSFVKKNDANNLYTRIALSKSILYNKVGKHSEAQKICARVLENTNLQSAELILAARRTMYNSLLMKGDVANALVKFKTFEESQVFIDNQTTSLNLHYTFKYIADAHEQLGNYEDAYLYFKKFYKREIELKNTLIEKSIYQILNVHNKEKFEFEIELNRIRNVELEKAKAQLNQKLNHLKRANDELENFAQIVSHDLREPVRNIASFAPLIQSQVGNKNEDVNQYLKIIETSAINLQNLVNGLVELTKIDKNIAHLERFWLSEVIENVKALLHSLLESKNAKITVEKDVEIKGSQVLITQLLQNLIANGIKYNNKQPQIEVAVSDKNEFWEIAVTDNGIGIKPEDTERIFMLFKRGASHDTEGLGMGLAICKKIVQHHNGQLWVHKSEEQVGTTIKFTIKKLSVVR